MTMREVVRQLQAQGHEIDYYIRKDGGILIRRIDGEKFQGAKGNARARQLAGATISEARISQLKYATRQQGRKKMSVDDEIQREYYRVKKIWKKRIKPKKGEPHPAGYFGWARIEYSIKQYGKEEALRRIAEAERYATGLAYSKNIKILSEFIASAGIQYNSQELIQLSEDLMNNAYSIRDEWIYPAYDELYKLNKGVPPKEVAKETRKILRL